MSLSDYLNKNVSVIPYIDRDSLVDMSLKWVSSNTGGVLTDTLNSTALFITDLLVTAIYYFLILLCRKGFKSAFITLMSPENQKASSKMIDNIQRVGQQYLTGMFILILVLGVLNSLGLFILGIDYALFFGFLAAFLAVIPYVGTTIGGAIPAFYAFMNYDSYWYALGVILIFWFIQIIEGNFLSPKIVVGNLNINALVAILALISGGIIWGISGMILFLPYTAILKVISEHYVELTPVSMILTDDLYERSEGSIKSKVTEILKKRK